MNCTVCAQPLDPALAPEVTHPSCSADSMWLDQDVPDPFNDILKQKLIRMIMWAENESPRSKQAEIGPSEVGGGCDRHIAYRLAGVAPINMHFTSRPCVDAKQRRRPAPVINHGAYRFRRQSLDRTTRR